LERCVVGLAQYWRHADWKKHSGGKHLIIEPWAWRCVVSKRRIEMSLSDLKCRSASSGTVVL
jgi:hypothetical protein